MHKTQLVIPESLPAPAILANPIFYKTLLNPFDNNWCLIELISLPPLKENMTSTAESYFPPDKYTNYYKLGKDSIKIYNLLLSRRAVDKRRINDFLQRP